MTVEFNIDAADFEDWNFYHNLHSPTARRNYLWGWFLPPAMWLIVFGLIWQLADQKRGTPLRTFLDLLPLFFPVPFLLIYYPFAYRRKLKKIIKGMVNEGKNRSLFGKHQVILSADGIQDLRELQRTWTSWKAVERIVKMNSCAYIYVSGLSAIIIPVRAFASESEFESFVQEAEGFLQSAQS
jgi:hypothetical protein